MDGIELISQERIRQIEQERRTTDHDSKHVNGELALAAVCYTLLPDKRGEKITADREGWSGGGRHYDSEWCLLGRKVVPEHWPWLGCYWKPTPNDRIRELVKAGALIAAEIDRLLEIQDKK